MHPSYAFQSRTGIVILTSQQLTRSRQKGQILQAKLQQRLLLPVNASHFARRDQRTPLVYALDAVIFLIEPSARVAEETAESKKVWYGKKEVLLHLSMT